MLNVFSSGFFKPGCLFLFNVVICIKAIVEEVRCCLVYINEAPATECAVITTVFRRIGPEDRDYYSHVFQFMYGNKCCSELLCCEGHRQKS